VQKVVTGTILPTATPSTWQVFIGTPWTENDILAYLKATGRYDSVRTPVERDGQPRWPERFSREEIENLRQAVGEVEFARMYLLDLLAASGVHLRREWLRTYPYPRIDPSWPVVMGVDYASAADELLAGQRDYFAVAIGRALPGGAGVVLVDGCRQHLSQGAAQAKLIKLAERYPTLQLVGVEAVGKGEEFFHLMLRTSRLPLQAGSRGHSKEYALSVHAPLSNAATFSWPTWRRFLAPSQRVGELAVGEHDYRWTRLLMLYSGYAAPVGGISARQTRD